MSNEYKEWEADRKEEAWRDLNKIAEIYEKMRRDKVVYPGVYYDLYENVREILRQGGWI